ncbi:adenylyl-sulfate kinase [Demequina zhanjiangensis]|uniref:Adenylyl-sulfate kinase n=1 Tax=Demequina zhanjiangensis TaxID=3051659 RepID=A0ABT8G4X4_9MICO|nr:adenylyl-sulfate kinase [Demequina sp. SYSU T00b26]MDN4473979.1 adenylyl-sulfate kinase [Demequina sp. SYSU T00b26]
MTEHRLTPLEHHDLELMVAGVLPARFALPESAGDAPVASLRLPVGYAGAVVTLLDREATPVAVVDVERTATGDEGVWVAGEVTMLRPLATFDFADLRPADSAPVVGAPTLLIGDSASLPEGTGPIVVVDHGDPRALADAVARVRAAGREVRVLPEPSFVSVTGDDRNLLIGRLASAAFGELSTVVVSEHRKGDGLVVLLTGLSGSGKSTIAKELAQLLRRSTVQHVTLLDGDEVRAMLSKGLGFTREDRLLNVQRIGWVAALIAEHGGVAIAAPIAPYAEMRAEMRERVEKVGRFVLVHVATPLEVCEARDRKGLYAKARAGEIANFTGISDPYDEPTDADVVITEDQSPHDAALTILAALSVVAPLPSASS